MRSIIILLLLIWLAMMPSAPQAQRSQGPDYFNKSIQPFFAENCYMCHNSKSHAGGLNLESYKTAASVAEHRETFETILQRMRAGEMPPEGLPRPNEAQLKAVMQWLEGEFARADRLIKPDPGRVTARRLNRAEYNNTVRDLLGVTHRPADDFPQDDSGYGFDNIGDVLSLSPALMEKYLAAAEKIARTAVYGPQVLKPTMVRRRSDRREIERSVKPLSDYDLTGLSLPNALHLTYRFPVDGEYNLRTYLGGERPAGSDPIQVAVWIDGQQVQTQPFGSDQMASFSPDRQDFGGQALDFRVKLTGGDHWVALSILNLYEGLPVKYGGPNPTKRPPPPPPQFRPPKDLPPERIEQIRKRFEARLKEVVPINDARIGYVEIAGPYEQASGPSPESLKKLYVCGHLDGRHQPGCERQIVANLARRAYRRPVTDQEVGQLTGLIALARKEGDSAQEGLVQAIQAILVSPYFLFRIERDPPAAGTAATESRPINQYELASRLSYFLWSSMPDDELFRCAELKTLSRPEVLATQVRRMLKDPHSQALIENFGGQWLELRKLEAVKPDRQRFPEFDEYLRMLMRRETELYFDDIVRQDRSILDFIDGNYAFLNERLAAFYRIPGVKGPEFRKVVLDGSTNRGGILTQASILTVSSYATRTSPVLRGKWILENIFNAPPPPPPPDVPNLDEAKIGSSASLRQQLEQHRTNAICASCHARMDPLGFGLENFDAIGAWRTQDGKFPIDASGKLPDGRSFTGPQGLKEILKTDSRAFTEGLTDKLLTYALGRGLERYDKPTVKKIAAQVAANNYRFSSLVLEITRSLPFQMRRGDRAL